MHTLSFTLLFPLSSTLSLSLSLSLLLSAMDHHRLHGIEQLGVGGEISKGFVEKLVWEMKRMAAPLLQPFGPKSDPTFICEEDLKPLKAKLARIRATLKDSEESHLLTAAKDESSKLWLSELRELEYSAEDILEEFEFECVRTTKLEEFRTQLRRKAKLYRKRKRDDVSILFSSPSVTSLRRKITKLGELYREIAFDRVALSLSEMDGERRPPHCSQRPPSSSIIVGDFHGRSGEMKKVINLLFSDQNQKCPFSVIPIVGMGGVGKTTLVKHVYGDEKVLSHFDLRMWICMSEGLDVVKVMRAIREALGVEASCPSELDLAQKDVVRVLRGKRFLLVLDDVWIAEQWRCHWEAILAPLEVAAKGSRVLLTTTDAGLAKFAGAVPYRLSCLPDSDCWLICQHHAFCNQNPAAYPDLVQIGKLINQKCKGLPLASMVLGCLLRTDLDEKHWKRVLESDLLSHVEFENDIMPVLRLSYDHLPMHLKHCFMYCSLFPKDYLFEKEYLVSLWIAQGFVKQQGRLGLKDAGSKYFDALVERSFFQPSPVNDQSQQRYVMHNLFHQLAESLAGLQFKRREDHKLCELHHKTRHSSLVPHEIHLKKSIQFELNDGQDLRSMLLIRRNKRIETPFRIEIPSFSLLQCLRALDLSNTDIEGLPVSIGSLIHLRYFGLKNTKIRRLPESICGLFKLHTLDLKQCCDLERLPLGLQLLSNLQNLELPSHIPNVRLPYESVDFTDLRTTSAPIEKNEHEFCGTHITNLRENPQISEIKIVVGEVKVEGLGPIEEVEKDLEVDNTMVQLEQEVS